MWEAIRQCWEVEQKVKEQEFDYHLLHLIEFRNISSSYRVITHSAQLIKSSGIVSMRGKKVNEPGIDMLVFMIPVSYLHPMQPDNRICGIKGSIEFIMIHTPVVTIVLQIKI